MAVTIEDVLARRLGLQLFSWVSSIEAAPVVRSVMAQLFGWTADERRHHVDEYGRKINGVMEGVGLKRQVP